MIGSTMPQANRLDFSVKSQRPPFIHIVCTEKKKQEKVYSFISSWLFIKPEPEVAVLNRKSAVVSKKSNRHSIYIRTVSY